LTEYREQTRADVAVPSSPTEVLDQAPGFFTLAKDYGLQDMYFTTPSNCEQTVQEEFHSYASGALSPQGTNILKYWEVRD